MFQFGPKELNIEDRRSKVAELRVKGFSSAEIATLLAEKGFVNDKGSAFSKVTICKDIKAIKKSWVEKYADQFELMQKRHFEEILMLKKIFWKEEDYDKILKLLSHEAKVLGLTDQQNIQINNANTMALPVITITCDEDL